MVLLGGMELVELFERGGDRLVEDLRVIELLDVRLGDVSLIVVGEEGSFQPVRVSTGRSAGGRTEILEGLQGGERVVTSGQFLIDSEASLSGALDRMTAPSDGSAGMEGMDMGPEPDAAEDDQ